MALTDKKISVKNIIAKVYQDLDLGEEEDIGRLIEWASEALLKIGVYNQLCLATDYKITINNYKAELPCELVYLDAISYNGFQLDGSSGNNIKRKYSSPYYHTPQAANQGKLENAPFMAGQLYLFKDQKDSFILDDGYIKTSFKKGDIYINYRYLPTDDEGFLLIPDHESFRDALFWYIAHKYFYIKSIKEDRYRWFYQDADRKYRYYINQAGAEAMMPDLQMLENIKRNYLQLLPKVNSYKNFFRDLNQPSNRFNTNAK